MFFNHAFTPQVQRAANDLKGFTLVNHLVGAVSGAGVIIPCIIICCCYLIRQRSQQSGPDNENIENFLLQHGSLAPKRYKYSEIRKITKSFKDKLGRGGYGSVYQGVLPDSCPVAVKVLIDSDSNGEEFINEVASISRTSHVNIVNLLGFCYGGNKRALVYEFMPNKSLDKFINNNGDCQLDWKAVQSELRKGPIIHTGFIDIKPVEILAQILTGQKPSSLDGGLSDLSHWATPHHRSLSYFKPFSFFSLGRLLWSLCLFLSSLLPRVLFPPKPSFFSISSTSLMAASVYICRSVLFSTHRKAYPFSLLSLTLFFVNIDLCGLLILCGSEALVALEQPNSLCGLPLWCVPLWLGLGVLQP
ncbi:LEAF RUST 10 DISEASE-RESISTANCE LOCUS RECEPTOR-LIKE PROTEIN KINASE-like 2.5 [Sesamum angolense]|uniref:LEAF RUST 10 DISEASE-RESISTANCE LOCUS RECEPTOR-LIKE PROTEIN KINASE-like 2.5 n=1 Tax=Sesamum angolense TaxID=2727404 RepID=A0AAE1XEY4_9LAMI|nr:LEAF RUST 10 DISEASE-RESISTANCE LOCUS RECEPTOR-LIKE PROTEIN KINASE-like 2.5 [Sesamum angolense]